MCRMTHRHRTPLDKYKSAGDARAAGVMALDLVSDVTAPDLVGCARTVVRESAIAVKIIDKVSLTPLVRR